MVDPALNIIIFAQVKDDREREKYLLLFD